MGTAKWRRCCFPTTPIVIIIIVCCLNIVAGLSSPIVSSYNILINNKLRNSQHQLTKQQTNFTHLALDTRTDRLFIGATNYLLKFDANLRLLQTHRTGPVDDSPQCSPTDCFSVDSKDIKPTNNFNKILVLDTVQRQLLMCGSVKQGACYQLQLLDNDDENDDGKNGDGKKKKMTKNLDLSDSSSLIRVPVAANDENSTSFAFIGPAHYGGTATSSQRVLYVAVTNTKLGQYRELVPAISARSLAAQDPFRIIESSFTDSARVDISSHLRDYFLVHYVYGFNYHDQIYFAQVQKRSHLRTQEEQGYHTRLSRICASDAGFQSYTEITLECQDHLANFNVLRHATLAKVGTDLAEGLGLKSKSISSGNYEVLLGVFSQSRDHHQTAKNHHHHHNHHQAEKSAVCAFSMFEIEKKFKENIHLCYNGSIRSRNMDYIAGSVNDCPQSGKAGNILNFCEETVKLNGSIPLNGVPLFKIDGTELTAIAATTAQNQLHTVAFLGTGNGKLLKVLLKEPEESKVFETVTVDTNSEPILSDLLFDSKQKYVYAATSKKVVKVIIEHCPQESNCTECLNLNNPFCGYCSLEKRCTSKSDCSSRSDYANIQDTRTAFSTPRWLPMDGGQCVNFEKITPSFVPIDKKQNIHLTIHQLPVLPYGSSYSCVYNDKIFTSATQVTNGLTCPLPSLSERPIIESGGQSDHVTMRLSVKASSSDTPFIQRSFAFYDCNVHKTCRSCVNAEFACTWCKMDNSCVSNQTSCDSRMAIISEHSKSNGEYVEKGASFCPSFKVDSSSSISSSSNNNEILIPNGASKEISLKVQNINDEQNGFQCMMEIEGARELVKATLQNDQLVCFKNVYTYQAEMAQYRAQLTILRNGNTFIDRTNVTLYKCELMGSWNGKSDCSLCQSSAARFQCSFCAGKCLFREECGLDDPSICPPPRIDLVYPLSGPIEGGTLVTIEGSNLGSSIDQLRNKISIGSSTCEPIQVIASIRVICKTQPPFDLQQQDQSSHSSKVVVANSAGLSFSQEKFHFKKIELNRLTPQIGPQAGGTQLFLSGKNFNIGSSIQVYLDELKCDVDKQLLSSEQLTCRTRPSSKPRQIQNLILIIDNSNLTIAKPFVYTENPSIKSIRPSQSYLSGGRILNVLGERFQSIQQPKMAVYYKKQLINETHCSIVNHSLMHCPTPSVKEFTRNFRLINGLLSTVTTSLENNQIGDLDFLHHQQKSDDDLNQIHNLQSNGKRTLLKLKISFGLDSSLRTLPLISDSLFNDDQAANNYQATASKSLSLDQQQEDQKDEQDDDQQKNYFTINYVSDPKVYKLHQSASSFNGDSLVIQGENLNNAISANELNVTIGGANCALTSLTENQLTCSAVVADRSSFRRKFYKDTSLSSSSNSNLLSSLLSISSSSEEKPIKPLPVIVRFSENLEFHLGFLTNEDSKHFRKLNGNPNSESFFSSDAGESNSSEQMGQNFFIKTFAVSALLLITFCLILLITYKRKSNEVEKEYKRMQLMMMDTLENSIRLEAKQAFVELQTDLTEVNNLNQDWNAALLPSTKYIANIFFPGLTVNPLSADYKLHNGQQHQMLYTNGRPLFEELLFSKHFLLTFIDVLEQQPSFTLRDRVNVASLLMITLIEKMDYAFCVLEELLLKSISTYAKNCPQLFLRRTEFIVEKMLVNFLAITMEDSLIEQSGRSLFLLVNAIQSQSEKGPIDFYTQEARYTLAEERLLKQQIEFNVVNLIVFKLQGSNEKIEYQVKVLDCDCISQVKNKILNVVYKTIPKSKRPELSDVILEHNYILNQTYSLKRNISAATTGQLVLFQNNSNKNQQQKTIYGQNIILEDFDDTTQIEQQQTPLNNWKKINTVKHYQLMNNSVITMKILNEQQQPQVYSTNQSLNNYTVYDNYTDSSTGHLYESIGQDNHSGLLPSLVLANNKYTTGNKYQLPDIYPQNQLPEDDELMMNKKNSIYGYNGSNDGGMLSNRLLKQQQMPLLGSNRQLFATTTNKKLKNLNTPSAYNVYYTLNRNSNHKSSNKTLTKNNDYQLTTTTGPISYYHLSKDVDQFECNLDAMSTTSSTRAIKNRSDTVIDSGTMQGKKLFKEIYLTRLLTTKATLQNYIDEFFGSVLTCTPSYSIVVKWLFDLLDDAAQMNGITDPEIIYAWKCNSLPLRFWVNLLKNPNYLFDLEKNSILDSNLNVIAQAFLDSCSVDNQVLNKESHSAKLLFAKDIPRYKEMVRTYYKDVKSLPKFSDDQLLNELKNCSKKYIGQIDRSNAINELLVYLTRYREVLIGAFYNDSSSSSMTYCKKLQIVLESIYSSKS